LFRGQARLLGDASHGIGVYGVVAWDNQYPHAVCHYYMLALPLDVIANLLQHPHCLFLVYATKNRHGQMLTTSSVTATSDCISASTSSHS
jgi:hypothetical protein